MFQWETWQPPLRGRNMHCEQLPCVALFLLALLSYCWESPVWSCHLSGNIYIPVHWEDLIKWTRFSCVAGGSFIRLLHCQIAWSACPALWRSLTASFPAGDSCRLAVGPCLLIWRRFYTNPGINILRIASIHPRLDFRTTFSEYRTVHTKISHSSLHILENSNSQFRHSHAAPSKFFFPAFIINSAYYQHCSNTIGPLAVLSALQMCLKTVLQAIQPHVQSLQWRQSLVGLLSPGSKESSGTERTTSPTAPAPSISSQRRREKAMPWEENIRLIEKFKEDRTSLFHVSPVFQLF